MSSIISGKTCDQSGRPVIMNWTVQTLVTTPWWLYSHSYQTSDINCMISFPINNLLFFTKVSQSAETPSCVYMLYLVTLVLCEIANTCVRVSENIKSASLYNFPLISFPLLFQVQIHNFCSCDFVYPAVNRISGLAQSSTKQSCVRKL